MKLLGPGVRAICFAGDSEPAVLAKALRVSKRPGGIIKKGGDKAGVSDRIGANLSQVREAILQDAEKQGIKPAGLKGYKRRCLNAADIYDRATKDGKALGVGDTSKIVWNTDRNTVIAAGVVTTAAVGSALVGGSKKSPSTIHPTASGRPSRPQAPKSGNTSSEQTAQNTPT